MVAAFVAAAFFAQPVKPTLTKIVSVIAVNTVTICLNIKKTPSWLLLTGHLSGSFFMQIEKTPFISSPPNKTSRTEVCFWPVFD